MSWYFENGPEGDVVVSTRIRFARNIAGHKFNSVATKEDAEKVLDIFKNNNIVPELKFIRLDDLDELMQNSLVEKHIISRDILNIDGAGLLLNADE